MNTSGDSHSSSNSRFFVIAMGIGGAYLVLSLSFSIVNIVRPHAVPPRLLFLIFDILALTLNTSCAAVAAAAAIVYLAHNGNSDANWLAICQQSSRAVVSVFVAVVIFVILILLPHSEKFNFNGVVERIRVHNSNMDY